MLELSTAKGCGRLIKQMGADEIIIKNGISPDLFEKVKGSTPWTGKDRAEVVRCLDALTHGTCDEAGVPRVAVPAEFRGYIIHEFVHPINQQIACQWSEVKASAAELAGSNENSIQHKPVSSSQLYGLVCMLEGTSRFLDTPFKNAMKKAYEEFQMDTKKNGKS